MDSRRLYCRTPETWFRGRIFGEMIPVSAQMSELQAKSRSYSRGDPQNPNRIAQKRKPNGVEVLLQKTPLKAFLNPANKYFYVGATPGDQWGDLRNVCVPSVYMPLWLSDSLPNFTPQRLKMTNKNRYYT